MKTHIVLFSLLILAACNPSAPEVKKSNSAVGGETGGSTQAQVASPSVVRVMNYNQYNMTLAKLTGINQSNFSALFNEIMGSLPAEGEIQGLTSFNLVSKTRLADAYCGMYVAALPDATVNNDGTVRDHFLMKFLDYQVGDAKYDSLVAELDAILANDDGQGGNYGTLTNRQLSVMACIATLASSHITLLE